MRGRLIWRCGCHFVQEASGKVIKDGAAKGTKISNIAGFQGACLQVFSVSSVGMTWPPRELCNLGALPPVITYQWASGKLALYGAGEIYYTLGSNLLDGDQPSLSATRYTGPFPLYPTTTTPAVSPGPAGRGPFRCLQAGSVVHSASVSSCSFMCAALDHR
jgi:hypothetical protein